MKLAIQLGVLSAANIGIAFLFQLCVLTQLGPTTETDALFAGMTVPQLVLMVVSGSLMHVLVPVFSGTSGDQLRQDAWSMLTLVVGFFGLLAVVLFLLAPVWVPLIVPGFGASAQGLTIELTRVQLVGMIFAAINSVQWAAYHARDSFVWAEFTPVITGVLAILLLLWALPRYGVIAAAWISTLRMALQTLLLVPGMGAPVRPKLDSPSILQSWQRIKPLLLGTAYYKTDPVVDRYLLSSASGGSLSLYYLAQQIYNAVTQVINKAITAPLVPALSKLYKEGDMVGFKRVYRRKLLEVFAISALGLVTIGVAGQNFLAILIGHRNVHIEDILQLWWIMLCLGGMFLGSAMGQITSSTFYSRGDTVTPVRLSIVSYTLYIPSKVAAYYFFGITGLAVSTSVYQLTNFALQMVALREKQQER